MLLLMIWVSCGLKFRWCLFRCMLVLDRLRLKLLFEFGSVLVVWLCWVCMCVFSLSNWDMVFSGSSI